jgi:trans-aconitate 2-methyltransferase
VSRRTTTDWDAKRYDRLAAPQERWARGVLERLSLQGDETVLDAGCGSGRVTRLLLKKLPEGRVIGVDGSPSMIELASQTFAGDDRVRLITSDLLKLDPGVLRREAGADSVDAVFSNATFHWIADHERLFARLFELLRPGGRLVTQCGGRGNVSQWIEAILRAAAREPFARHIEGFEPWNFYGDAETTERLKGAGFVDVHCWLEEVDAVRPDDPRDFVTVVGLAAHQERLPEELREPFTDAVIEELPQPVELRYIRLNADARRPE